MSFSYTSSVAESVLLFGKVESSISTSHFKELRVLILGVAGKPSTSVISMDIGGLPLSPNLYSLKYSTNSSLLRVLRSGIDLHSSDTAISSMVGSGSSQEIKNKLIIAISSAYIPKELLYSFRKKLGKILPTKRKFFLSQPSFTVLWGEAKSNSKNKNFMIKNFKLKKLQYTLLCAFPRPNAHRTFGVCRKQTNLPFETPE